MGRIELTESIAKVADSAKNVTIIVGIIVTMFGLYKGYKELSASTRSQKLSTFGTDKELIKADEEQRVKIHDVLANKASIPGVLEKYGEMGLFYHSKEATPIVSVGRHYEQLGALVRLGYVDFDLVYEIIPFPDQFWEATAPVHAGARTNWSGGKGLLDFWKNFEYLKTLYDKQRALDSKNTN